MCFWKTDILQLKTLLNWLSTSVWNKYHHITEKLWTSWGYVSEMLTSLSRHISCAWVWHFTWDFRHRWLPISGDHHQNEQPLKSFLFLFKCLESSMLLRKTFRERLRKIYYISNENKTFICAYVYSYNLKKFLQVVWNNSSKKASLNASRTCVIVQRVLTCTKIGRELSLTNHESSHSL